MMDTQLHTSPMVITVVFSLPRGVAKFVRILGTGLQTSQLRCEALVNEVRNFIPAKVPFNLPSKFCMKFSSSDIVKTRTSAGIKLPTSFPSSQTFRTLQRNWLVRSLVPTFPTNFTTSRGKVM